MFFSSWSTTHEWVLRIFTRALTETMIHPSSLCGFIKPSPLLALLFLTPLFYHFPLFALVLHIVS